MRVLFDGTVPVAYGQIYVVSRAQPDMDEAFAGQVNGLCGARQPGALFLMTGTHTGRVRFTVQLYDAAPPPPAPRWQDVVEAPFLLRAATVDLVPWGDGSLVALPLTGDTGVLPAFRVRYCAAGMDEGQDPFGGADPDGDYQNHRPDRYLLCFWPAEGGTAADVILRQGSGAAAYWHDWAAALPPPPTLSEQVEAELRVRAERDRREQERRLRDEARRWGGRAPTERLRRVTGNVFGIARLDRDLVDAIAATDAGTQRRVAIWAARQAFTVAGIADLDWLAPAWAALDGGEPLPAAYTDTMAMLDRVIGTPTVRFSVVRSGPRDRGRTYPVNPAAMALPALPAAALPDPLQAALEAVWAAATTYDTRAAEFLREIRRAFPLGGPGTAETPPLSQKLR